MSDSEEMVERTPEITIRRTNDGMGWTWNRTQIGQLRENGATFPSASAALLDAYEAHSDNSLIAACERLITNLDGGKPLMGAFEQIRQVLLSVKDK